MCSQPTGCLGLPVYASHIWDSQNDWACLPHGFSISNRLAWVCSHGGYSWRMEAAKPFEPYLSSGLVYCHFCALYGPELQDDSRFKGLKNMLYLSMGGAKILWPFLQSTVELCLMSEFNPWNFV